MKLCIRIEEHMDGGFRATCPTLPGCMCKGRSREEARERLDEAIRGYFAAVNNFVPEMIQEQVIEA